MAKAEFVASAPVGLVVGPAGSGKSVLLRQLAARAPSGHLVLTCGLDSGVTTEAALIARLARVIGVTAPAGLDGLLDELARRDTSRLVVHLDDAHHLVGTPGDRALARLLAEAPSGLRFVVAGRDDRVAGIGGTAPRVGYDDLRLRPSEVAELFTGVYEVPLSPAEAARLCARVEGLAGAVRLLHLDTVLLSERDRAETFAAPLTRSPRLVEFLTREVFDPLPAPLREFMVAAAPLGVLDGPLCDVLLDRTGSRAAITELAARQALTFRVSDGGGAHRFHVLLQQYLERCLAERAGAQRSRQAYRSAAKYLAGAGRWAEAYRCHAHAGDWVAAAAVLHRFGARPGGIHADAALPAPLLGDDPWVALADARRLRGEGRLDAAHRRYADAEALLPDPALRWQCTTERSGVAGWLGRPGDPLVDDINRHLADALRRHPAKLLNRAVPAQSPGWTLGRAVAALLDGRPDRAVEIAGPLANGPVAFVALASRILVAVVESVGRPRRGDTRFADLAAECEEAGWLWLARLARAATAVVDEEGCADAAAVLDECCGVGDEWGTVLAGCLLAVGRLRAGLDAAEVLETAASRARALGARVPETWLRLVLADEWDRRGDPRAHDGQAELRRLAADTVIDRVAAQGKRLVAAIRTPVPRRALVAVGEPAAEPPAELAVPAVVRCLGRYTLTVAGTEVGLGGLRAQARQVLRMLSVQYGHPLHEERLMTAMWPDCPANRTKHRLQVAVSSLRALLRAHLPAEYGILRHGNSYLLRLPPGSLVDVVEFAETVRRWRTARQAGDTASAMALGYRVLDLYRGELLVEEGPAEWVLARREAVRGEAAGAAAVLAGTALNRGDAAEAIEVCERGVTIDELDNRLWSLLAAANVRAGNRAAAARAEGAYQALLADGG
ncbi:AAA family ATPase [Amycolatopsis sp. NBC_00345]|uniref:BTAD domain-containing putative transcriptional regulator n=1 Tax=Amycolatopsis sp. NBC_00345 TaxID=2975955 RepID=UPI002E25DCC4